MTEKLIIPKGSVPWGGGFLKENAVGLEGTFTGKIVRKKDNDVSKTCSIFVEVYDKGELICRGWDDALNFAKAGEKLQKEYGINFGDNKYKILEEVPV